MKPRLRLSALLVVALLVSACASAIPPNLSPAARQAWQNTKVVKSLDLVRDIAIDANAQQPPLLSERTTRKVVLYHESALKIIQAIPDGWKPTVSAGLRELRAELAPSERDRLGPYLALADVVIQEIK